MSAVLRLEQEPADTAAPRPARRRPVPSSLPRGLGRLAALTTAIPVTLLTAQLVAPTAALPLARSLPLVLAAVLLLFLVALGVRLRIIVTTAAISLLIAAVVWIPFVAIERLRAVLLMPAEVQGVKNLVPYVWLVPAVACVTFVLIAWRPVVWARELFAGLVLGAAAVVAATAWPPLAVLSFWALGRAEPLALLWVVGIAPLAWLIVTVGRSTALQSGRMFSTLRDALFRALTLAASVTASVWVGDAAERAVAAAAMGSPLEGLAPTAGWATSACLAILLAWTAWRLPRWVVVGQLRGRFDATAVGETLVAAVICCLVPLALWRLKAPVVLGRDWVVALAAAGSYACVRLWFAAPAPRANLPLWLLVPGGTASRLVQSPAARVAGAWRAGQVTVLGTPEDARHIGGEHLRAAALAGHIDTLFPLRPIDLDDWTAAQPDAWAALHVRELYAPPELWPHVLRRQVEDSALVVALLEPPDRPAPALLDRLRHAFATDPARAALVPRSSAPGVRPGMPAERIEALATEVVDGERPLEARLRALQPRAPRPTHRYIVVFCAPGERAAAERVTRLVHGQLDEGGRIVECRLVVHDPARAAWRLPLQLGWWRLSALLLARRLGARPTRSPRRIPARLAIALLDGGTALELDVVVWEAPDGAVGSEWLIELPASGPAMDRLIVVRPAGAAPMDATALPTHVEAGEIHVSRADSTETLADLVARKLLAIDLIPLTLSPTAGTAATAAAASPAAGDSVPAESPPNGGRHAVYLTSSLVMATGTGRRLLQSLYEGLGWDVLLATDAIPAELPARADVHESMRRRIERARAVVVVVHPALATAGRESRELTLVTAELSLAASLGKTIVPVLVDGVTADDLRGQALFGSVAAQSISVRPDSWERDVRTLVDRLRTLPSARLSPHGEPTSIFVSSELTESTVFAYREVLESLRDRFPDLTLAGSDSVGRGEMLLPERAAQAMGYPAVTVVLIGRTGVRHVHARAEIESALARSERVIPVLLDGATMPEAAELPPALLPLTRLQALRLESRRGREGIARLLDAVARALGRGPAAVEAAPSVPAGVSAGVRIYLCSHVDESAFRAMTLWRALTARFGTGSTHTDLAALLPAGAPPDPSALPETALALADVVVVVIGRSFVTELGSPEQSGEAASLRSALAAALRLGRPIVPVLVGGAPMPRPRELPEELADLWKIQGFPLRDDSLHEDVARLGDVVEATIARGRGRNS